MKKHKEPINRNHFGHFLQKGVSLSIIAQLLFAKSKKEVRKIVKKHYEGLSKKDIK